MAINDRIIAIFGLFDFLRLNSRVVITEFQKRNIAISIISSDNAGAVEAVILKLNIPAIYIKFKCTFSIKQKYFKNLIPNKKRIFFLRRRYERRGNAYLN